MLRNLHRILLVSCLFLAVLATQATAQHYTQLSLPEGAKMRLGKGWISGPITYSPDSTRLAVASSIGIWLYNIKTNQEIALLTGHTREVRSLAFSPDGNTLASGGKWPDNTIRLWDVMTGKHKHTLKGHIDTVSSVVFSPDGNILASRSYGGWQDNTIRLWDVMTGKHKHTLKGHIDTVSSVVFSPNGNTLASGSSDKTIRLWDVMTGKHKHTLTGHTGNITSIAFSPDGNTLASGSSDETIRLWDVDTGEHKRTLMGHTNVVTRVVFNPDGNTLASGSRETPLWLWDAITGETKRTFKVWSNEFVFSLDGGTLAIYNGPDIHLWDVDTDERKHTLTGHIDAVSSVIFSPDGRTLASESSNQTIRLWDAITGEHKWKIDGYMPRISSLAFSTDGGILASGTDAVSPSHDAPIHLWDGLTGEPMEVLIGHTGRVSGLTYSPEGDTLASGGGGTVRLWDVITGETKRTFKIWSNGLAFSPDGGTLATDDGPAIRLWNAVTGKRKQRFRGHKGNVSSVAFSPDGRTLISGSRDKTIRLWDVTTGKHKHTLTGHKYWIESVAFSPDGQILASGSWDDTVRLWDAVTGEHKEMLTGHTSGVNSVAFSPDGQTLASGSQDSIVHLWDTVTGEHKETLTGHTGDINSVAFSPDGWTLASGGNDGTILIWDITPSVTTNAIVSISPTPVPSPAIGERFLFSINIANGGNVVGYQATVVFDSTALRYAESSNGDYLPAGAFVVPPVVDVNRVTLAATALAGVSNGDGTLATLTFEVVAVKKSPLILSQVILTDSDGEYLPLFLKGGRVVEPAVLPSSAIVSVTPSRLLSPAIGGQLVFNVDIADGQDVAEYQLAWEFDNTTLKHISTSQGDYLVGGVGNGDGRLMTGTFEVLAVKASTVSVAGYLTASNGLRSIPTFESAEVVVPLLGDVNRDGTVNILDLILVASSFGQPVPEGGNPADINEDGVINIVDLVKVAGAIGNAGAAPSAQPEKLSMLTTTDVQGWITQAQGLDLADATLQRGIIFLQQLLAALTPRETALLPNYPNPFNPETWIPYHLAHDADVRLTIYDIKGVVVRQLDLGHQSAGYYTARAKAAYWDGRNSLGEVVGSGVYFYQLSTGDFSATRKMVILK